jgi:peptidoglycan/xylan/chitin deacetylase (PgdA/CDA1 family)
MRTPFRLVAAAAVALTISACGAGPGEPDDPSKPGGSGKDAVAITSVDPALVQGLHPTIYTDEERNVHAEVPVVASARQMTAALEVLRERGLREASWAEATEVRVDYRVVASGPGTLGIIVTPTWQTAAGETTDPALVWYDAGSKRVYSSPVLIREDQWTAFKAEVLRNVGRKIDPGKVGQALDSEAAPQGDGPMLGFNTRGDLVVQFAPKMVSEQAVALKVPADAAEPLLTDFGRRAAAASTQPATFDGTPAPGTSPAPASATPAASAGSTPAATPGATPAATPGATPAATPRATPAATPRSTRPSTAVGPDCRVLTCIALTYDDGPGAETPDLVEFLRDAKAPATFFQLGQMVEANPEAGKQVASAGNEIASHSMSHPDLVNISGERLTREIDETADVLEETYGRRPMIMRPPYGSHNKTVDEVVRQSGAAIIQWDLDTFDWRTRSASATEKAVLNNVRANAIVLMHDIHSSTVAAAPGLLEGLKGTDATLVTVSELSLNSGGYQAGHAYCSGTAAQAQSGFNCAG